MDSLVIKHSQSIRATLLTGVLVVTEVDGSLLPKCKNEDDKIKHLKELDFWQKEKCEESKDDYQTFSMLP